LDDVSITKPLAGNHQPRGRTGEIVARTHDSHLWEKSKKIAIPKKKGLQQSLVGKEYVIEEIFVEGDVGDFIDDVIEEGSDKIFLDTNPSLKQLEIDWNSPPKFDEYKDEECENCEADILEDVHVVIQEDGKYNFLAENDSKISPLPILEISTALKEVTPDLVNGSWIALGSYSPSIIGGNNSDLINGFTFQDGKVTEDGNWIFCGGVWDESSFVIAYSTNVNMCTRSIGRINLRYKADADNRRRVKFLQAKLEDEFFSSRRE
jgi:hypothetical protein